MTILTEKPVKVRADKVFPISKSAILGSCTDDITCSVAKNGDKAQVSLKGKLIVDSVIYDSKGYAEIVVEGKRITVGLEGTNVIVDKVVSGYYLIHKDDLRVLLKGK